MKSRNYYTRGFRQNGCLVTSNSLETDQFEVSFCGTTNCIPKLTMIIKYKVRNGKKVWHSQVVRYVCNGIYYKNKKDLLERCNVVFNFIK